MTIGGYTLAPNLDHDPDLAIALGNMVVTWANAEGALWDVMHVVTGLEINTCIAIYHRIPTFESRVKVVREMLAKWDSPKHDIQKIDNTIYKLSQLALKRNRLIHGTWATSPKKDKTVVFNYRRPAGTPERTRAVKASDINQHCEAVQRRALQIVELLYDT